jgi:hypothetical protein
MPYTVVWSIFYFNEVKKTKLIDNQRIFSL